MPIQIVVADQHGLNVGSLIHCIESHYQSANGHPVTVAVGRGPYIDGLPEGALVLRDDLAKPAPRRTP